MLLLGSHALDFYVTLDRKKHDIDLLMSECEYETFSNNYKKYWVKTTEYSHVYDINGNIVEVRNPKHLDDTDVELLYWQFDSVINFHELGIFGVKVPDVQWVYDIKLSTAMCMPEEPKHKYDVQVLERTFFFQKNTEFFKRRLAETQARSSKAKKAKYDFFHKYKLPEYIAHDNLHEMISDLLDMNMPTYKRLLTDDTSVAEELYNKLTHEQKVSLQAEESLVLALERWLLPQNIENGINYRVFENFFNNNEAMPSYLILKHVCVKGLKGEASYIVEHSRKYFFEVEAKWLEYKDKIKQKGGFPQEFYKQIYDIRKRYLAGEKVATL